MQRIIYFVLSNEEKVSNKKEQYNEQETITATILKIKTTIDFWNYAINITLPPPQITTCRNFQGNKEHKRYVVGISFKEV